MPKCLVAAVVIVLAYPPTLTSAQNFVTVGGELDEYLRLLELLEQIPRAPLVFRPSTLPRIERSLAAPESFDWRWAGLASQPQEFESHPWASRYSSEVHTRTSDVRVFPLDPQIGITYNSEYPRTGNDGAVWSGKGLTASVQAGFQLQWGKLTGTFYPIAYTAANRDFPLQPHQLTTRPEIAYQWHGNIDFPQRFGEEAVSEFDLGQSSLRVDIGGFTAGISNENLWWGPSFKNPIIMGNSAPGFPHVDLGTGHPVSVGFGLVETRLVWGELRESDFFDTNPDNDRRYITGLTMGFAPSFLPGFMIGATRLFYEAWPSTFGADDLARVGSDLIKFSGAADSADQLLSVTARWRVARAELEVYGEWARNDFNGSFRDLVQEPDHSRGYTLGFRKGFASGDGILRLRGELTTLGRSVTALVRANPTFYVHNRVHQGYTHRGQLMGAAIGPGSQSQYLGLDRYHGSGRWGLFVQRIRYYDDAYFELVDAFDRHDVEFTFGASALQFVGDFDVGFGLEISPRLNWNFEPGNDVTNILARFTLKWHDPNALRRSIASARDTPDSR